MADERLRRTERRQQVGDPDARRRLRWERLRLAPEDVEPLLADLDLDAWNELPDPERLEVAELFARVLQARGRPMDLLGVRRYGPDSNQPIARYRDHATGVVYSLVPGGQFVRGLTEAQVARLVSLGDFGPEIMPRELQRASSPITVRPFLMSVAPVPMGSPALPTSIRDGTDLSFVLRDHLEHVDDSEGACYVNEASVDAALKTLGAVLPDAAQLEWAARGGQEQLFPWGDDPRSFQDRGRAPNLALILSRGDAASTEWPLVNRFGLIAVAGASVWVRLKRRLGAWGGAGEGWPWQGAGWLSVVPGWTYVEDRYPGAHALRPVIPIGPRH